MICTLSVSAQVKQEKSKVVRTGVLVMVGGVALTIGSVATPGEFMRQNGTWQPMSIWRQDARFAGIVTGAAFTVTGGLTALLNIEPKRRRGIRR